MLIFFKTTDNKKTDDESQKSKVFPKTKITCEAQLSRTCLPQAGQITAKPNIAKQITCEAQLSRTCLPQAGQISAMPTLFFFDHAKLAVFVEPAIQNCTKLLKCTLFLLL
jgi:hypothetical protein